MNDLFSLPSGSWSRLSCILYMLSHPISINPFKSALFVTFVCEREKAVTAASNGDISVNEQLVWCYGRFSEVMETT